MIAVTKVTQISVMEIVVMLPDTDTVVMLPLRVVMLPASAAGDIAKVKSEAQRIDLKRFI
jgi:hypothetical protein